MSWFKKILPAKIRTDGKKSGVPEGLWVSCKKCTSVLYLPELENNLHVCPQCGHHMRLTARKRLDLFFDPKSTEEIAENILPKDILNFKDTKPYKDRIKASQEKTGESDALVVMKGQVNNVSLVASAFEFSFMGGSMGSVVGERFVRGVEYCLDHKLPFVCFTASGGARMQESLFSLMQMSKVSAALAKLKEAGLPYICVLTDPTTGGVSASLAMLGDIHLAEPKALIGFAGPRVIQQTVRETLPEGFQRSEFLEEKGMVDKVVHRKDLRGTVSRIAEKLMYHVNS